MSSLRPPEPPERPPLLPQKHRICRQILEISTADRQRASRLQERLGGLGRHLLEPLVDRCLSEIAPPHRLHRIDRLELDLGRLDPDHLEQQLAAKLDHHLRKALTARITDRQGDRSELDATLAAQLELLEHFARTGTLPWWADPTAPRVLDDCLLRLIRDAPDPLIAAVRDIARAQQLRRVVAHATDETLAGLIGLFVPVADLRSKSVEQTRTLLRVLPRVAIWRALFETVCAGTVPPRQADPSFWLEVLARLALATGEPYAGLVARLRHKLEAMATPAASELNRVLSVEPGSAGTRSTRDGTPALDDHAKEPGARNEDRPSASPDKVYVDTSGLVLLWPFLPQLLTGQDLLVDGDFRSREARRRAVGLVHFLARADPEPPEYQVHLAKILCGMSLDEAFELDSPISEGESAACSALLRAAIAHAPVLNEMSPEGFRGTFLLRQGVLELGGDVWLLRVERQAYDAVFDQLPWLPGTGGSGWVGLPWMAGPLQVDW